MPLANKVSTGEISQLVAVEENVAYGNLQEEDPEVADAPPPVCPPFLSAPKALSPGGTLGVSLASLPYWAAAVAAVVASLLTP